MLADEKLREFLPAQQLAQQVADKILKRAGDYFALGDSGAGWRDLHTADRLGGNGNAANQLKQHYASQSLDEVHGALVSNQPAVALARIEKLRQRGMMCEQARRFQQIAGLQQ
jgi:hypothetical protein